MTVLGLVALAVQTGVSGAQEPAGKQPWPADVPGFVKPAPGEHPRLLFRKADLPALRARAQTPEGKAILIRLRKTLGGNGEVFPEFLPLSTKGGDHDKRSDFLAKPGCLSLSHTAGYGLLYQLTGEKKYADLGRQAFEKHMEGVRDVDDRYSFVAPDGELRGGSSWASAAVGYDLCYEGWDPEFRAKAAKAFLTVEIQQKSANLKTVVTAPKYGPAKNHFGGIMCGATAAAAIMGDPGTEGTDIWGEWLPKAYENTRRMLTGGFGDHGFYSEGHGPSSVSADTGLLIWLKAAKIACGKDFISPAPNAQWVTLRRVMEVVPFGGRPQWPDRKSSAGPSYGTEDIWRHRGSFANGFGAIEDKYKPALLWTYVNFVESCELKGVIPDKRDPDYFATGWMEKGEKSYDAVNKPLNAVMAFVNWPIGVKPENPATVIPKAVEDRVHGYYMFRNQWQDENDIIVTALLGYGPKDAYKPQFGPIYLWGLGKKYSFGKFLSAGPADFKPGPNGGVVSTGTQCLGVDFSGASGAPAVIALVGIDAPKADNLLTVTPAGKITIVTMQSGKAPEVKADGDKVTIGGQTITWDGKKIAFGK
jgi:hypothetical protein